MMTMNVGLFHENNNNVSSYGSPDQELSITDFTAGRLCLYLYISTLHHHHDRVNVKKKI